MITQPKLEDRKEQPYVGIRSQIPMQELPMVIPQRIGEVAAWLEQLRAHKRITSPPYWVGHSIGRGRMV